MPNHIKNHLKFIGTVEDISALIEKYTTVIPASLNKAYGGDIICENEVGDC